jgi:hypothetical protein
MNAAAKTGWVLTALSMSFVGLSAAFIFGSVKANRMTETRNANLAGAKRGLTLHEDR